MKFLVFAAALFAASPLLAQESPPRGPAKEPSPRSAPKRAQPVESGAPSIQREYLPSNPFSKRRLVGYPAPTTTGPVPPPPPVAPGQAAAVLPGAEAGMSEPPPAPKMVSLGAQPDGRTFIGVVGDKALYKTTGGLYVFESFEIK